MDMSIVLHDDLKSLCDILSYGNIFEYKDMIARKIYQICEDILQWCEDLDSSPNGTINPPKIKDIRSNTGWPTRMDIPNEIVKSCKEISKVCKDSGINDVDDLNRLVNHAVGFLEWVRNGQIIIRDKRDDERKTIARNIVSIVDDAIDILKNHLI